MQPIYAYLGANEGELPWLNMAGPMTGLLVQPIIGALSDRTLSRYGRRTPYFLIGAVFCSLALFAMPYSSTIWMAASLLWILDAANNVTMEPYRAYVSDRLRHEQQAQGFLWQSAFTGLAQTLAYLAPVLLVWFGMDRNMVDANNIPLTVKVSFFIGAVLSVVTIFYSILSVRELPLTPQQVAEIEDKKRSGSWLGDIWVAIREMPSTMRQLWWMSLFQWFGFMCYWVYVHHAIARGLFGTSDPTTDGFRSAGLVNGQNGAFYNFVAFLSAIAMIPLARRFGAKYLHATCLVAGGVGLLLMPRMTDRWLMLLPMIGMGLAWGSTMGNPYIILARSIPPARTGVYMGIFNMFIVIPMLIFNVTFEWIYSTFLGKDARHAVMFGGAMLIIAAVMVLLVKVPKDEGVPARVEA